MNKNGIVIKASVFLNVVGYDGSSNDWLCITGVMADVENLRWKLWMSPWKWTITHQNALVFPSSESAMSVDLRATYSDVLQCTSEPLMKSAGSLQQEELQAIHEASNLSPTAILAGAFSDGAVRAQALGLVRRVSMQGASGWPPDEKECMFKVTSSDQEFTFTPDFVQAGHGVAVHECVNPHVAPWRQEIMERAGDWVDVGALLMAIPSVNPPLSRLSVHLGDVFSLCCHSGLDPDCSVPLPERFSESGATQLVKSPIAHVLRALWQNPESDEVVKDVLNGFRQRYSVDQWNESLKSTVLALGSSAVPTVYECFFKDLGLKCVIGHKGFTELASLLRNERFLAEILIRLISKIAGKEVTSRMPEKIRDAFSSGDEAAISSVTNYVVSKLSQGADDLETVASGISLAHSYRSCLAGARRPPVFGVWLDTSEHSNSPAEIIVQAALEVIVCNLRGDLSGNLPERKRQIEAMLITRAGEAPMLQAPQPLSVEIPLKRFECGFVAGWRRVVVFLRRVTGREATPWGCLHLGELSRQHTALRAKPQEALVSSENCFGPLLSRFETSNHEAISQSTLSYLFNPVYEIDPKSDEIGAGNNGDSYITNELEKWRVCFPNSPQATLPAIRYCKHSHYEVFLVAQHLVGTLSALPNRLSIIQCEDRYLRRVSIGKVGLVVGSSSGERSISAPKGVRLLADDLGLTSPGGKELGVKTPAYILHGGYRARLTIAIRCPGTGLMNWRIWTESVIPGELKRAGPLFIRTLNDLERRVQEPLVKSMLPDPAVAGVSVKLEVRAKDGEYRECRSEVILIKLSLSEQIAKLVKARDQLGTVLNRVCDVLFEPITVSIENHSTSQWSLKDAGIYRLAVTPLILADEVDRFSPESIKELEFQVLEENSSFVQVGKAVSMIFIEVPPKPESAKMPSPEEIWKSLQNGLPTHLNSTSRISILPSPQEGESSWRWVRGGLVTHQTWTWNGIPFKARDLLDGAVIASGAGSEQPPNVDQGMAEMLAYAGRDEDVGRRLSFELNLAQLPTNCHPVELVGFTPRGAPCHHRLRIELTHRYRGLPGFEEVATSAPGANWASGEGARFWPTPTQWVRRVERGELSALPAPAVHFVVPLLDSSCKRSRPGFLVLLRETLSTPFHQLEAVVDTEKLQETVVPSVGNWPVQAVRGVRPREVEAIVGEIAGLGYNSESRDPLLVHAAAAFETPEDLAPAEQDLYMRARFRWRLLGNGDAKEVEGAISEAWGVWCLGAFDEVVDRAKPQTRIPISELRFSHLDSKLTFVHPPRDQDGVSPMAVRPVDDGEKPFLFIGLLFVVWENVTSQLGEGLGRRFRSLWKLPSGMETECVLLAGSDASSGSERLSGQFLQIYTRDGVVGHTDGKTLWQSMDKDNWHQFLFPEARNGRSEKERALIARVSKAIRNH